MAQDAGAVLETEAMVTGWAGERALQITSPRGVRTVTADAVVLATGARERPRPARLVPGDRPDGVYTTGQLQNLVHLHEARVGSRALIVGAELVSWSAVLTLRESGCATVGMVSGYPRAEAYAAFRVPGRLLMDGPVLHAQPAGRASTVRTACAARWSRTSTAARRTAIDCDTVVFTGDWIPDHELARTGGLAMDPATRGPVVDAGLRTSSPGVFAVGNLLHPVDTADGAALDGRHVADRGQSLAAASGHGQSGRPRSCFRPVAMGCPTACLARGRRRCARRPVVLGRRVPQAAQAAGGAGRPRHRHQPYAVARRAGQGVPGAVVAGVQCQPSRRRRHSLLS